MPKTTNEIRAILEDCIVNNFQEQDRENLITALNSLAEDFNEELTEQLNS